MNVFDLFAKITLDSTEYEKGLDEAEKKTSDIGQKISGGLVSAAKVGAAAIGAAGAAAVGLSKTSVSAYADYEQLVGGVETLYGNTYKTVEEYAEGMGLSLKDATDTWEFYQKRQETVLDNAKTAYKTAGLSANEYMEQVTSFAAALNSSLGESAWQSANVADVAITNMADNANKMGTSIEAIQTSYAGFSKQNFSMLDNLKLGYGGTKSEMERLMKDAAELAGYDVTSFADVNNFAHIIEAIDIMQEHLGIAGTTAKEAGSTISGSIASMKGAWTNLVAGLANPDADLGVLIGEMVDSAETVLKNLLPAIEQALKGIANLIAGMAPVIAEKLPGLLQTILPKLMEAATVIIKSLGTALPGILSVLVPELIKSVSDILSGLTGYIFENVPVLFRNLGEYLKENLPVLLETGLNMLMEFTGYLRENFGLIVDAALDLIKSLADGLIAALPVMIETIPTIISNIAGLINDNAPKILETGVTLIVKLAQGIVKAIPVIIRELPKIIKAIVDTITAFNWINLGKQVVKFFAQGIKGMFSSVVEAAKGIIKSITEGGGLRKLPEMALKWAKDMLDNFIKGIKDKIGAVGDAIKGVASKIKAFIGFSEPSDPSSPLHNFHTFAPDMMALFAKGIKDNTDLVTDQLEKSFDFKDVITGPGVVMAGAGNGSIGGAYGIGGAGLGNAGLGYMGGSSINSILSDALSNITIQVNIGQDRVDDLVVKAIQRNNYRSGGR